MFVCIKILLHRIPQLFLIYFNATIILHGIAFDITLSSNYIEYDEKSGTVRAQMSKSQGLTMDINSHAGDLYIQIFGKQ